MSHTYQDADEDIAASYKRIHANDEQTVVYILSAGDDWYLSVACDVDPVEADPGAAELVAYAPTIKACHKRTERWLETHSRGVMADEKASGIVSKIAGALQTLDQSDSQPTEDDHNA